VQSRITWTAAAAALLLLQPLGVSAAPILTYDSPVLFENPGDTLRIGATLTLAQTDNPIVTDQDGANIVHLSNGWSFVGYQLYTNQQAPTGRQRFSARRPTTSPGTPVGFRRLRTQSPI
jgi:hypothetical protein